MLQLKGNLKKQQKLMKFLVTTIRKRVMISMVMQHLKELKAEAVLEVAV